MHRALLIDLGWTIEDETLAQIDRADKAVAACRELGIPASREKFIELQDQGGKNGERDVFSYALARLGLSETNIAAVFRKAQWSSVYITIYPNAAQVLEALSKDNILGIVANQSKQVHDRLSKYGILQYFKFVVVSCDAGCSKPDPEIFRMALSKIDKGIRDIWMIGDRIDNDIVPAKKMGLKTVRVLQGSHRLQKPAGEEERADYSVDRFSEILNIKELNRGQ
jgi:HAD superfamily hydrolase (TIGR01549 family)